MAHAQPGEAAACAEEETARLARSQVFQAGVLRTPRTRSPWRPSCGCPGVGAQPLSPCAVHRAGMEGIPRWQLSGPSRSPGDCTTCSPGTLEGTPLNRGVLRLGCREKTARVGTALLLPRSCCRHLP